MQVSALTAPLSVNSEQIILGGVRLPPDIEIIKYTTRAIGPKVPGATNREHKKSISLDHPSVSVMPTLSSTGLVIERKNKQPLLSEMSDHVEMIKLPSAVSNGRDTPVTYAGAEMDAPLNLSLKPSSYHVPCNNNALQSLSLLCQSLGTPP
ncbi:uncharacterized protein LOC120354831 isoform X2 [Nilaparvata lugens]|uniref:uncharacterized protein LOC120354831 isoform X2 n=1 Tax=Nilaparvata lugens TaxID=108931 RepID=UPI00193D3205|nr:uncharacterized protein LOC120354831 isoform X2 [Nilaparvata lugens]